jgi:hypothetical protein
MGITNRTAPQNAEKRARSRRTKRLGVAALLIIGFIILWPYFDISSFHYTRDYLRGESVLVYPRIVLVGDARVGEKRDAMVSIWNRSGEPLTILGIQTSCPCVASQELIPLLIPPGQSRQLPIRVNYGDDPHEFVYKVSFFSDRPGMTQIDVLVAGAVTVGGP